MLDLTADELMTVKGKLTVKREMEMDEIRYSAIGIIHSPYKEVKGMPLQPCGAT
jgi:hypothetical protein